MPLAKPPTSSWGWGGQDKPSRGGLFGSHIETQLCRAVRVSQEGPHADNTNPKGREAGTRWHSDSTSPGATYGGLPPPPPQDVVRAWGVPVPPHTASPPASPSPLPPSATPPGPQQLCLPSGACLHPSTSRSEFAEVNKVGLASAGCREPLPLFQVICPRRWPEGSPHPNLGGVSERVHPQCNADSY